MQKGIFDDLDLPFIYTCTEMTTSLMAQAGMLYHGLAIQDLTQILPLYHHLDVDKLHKDNGNVIIFPCIQLQHNK